jgi:TIR domain
VDNNRGGHFFVSYSRGDSSFALELAHKLRAAGIAVWVDQLDILGGEIWDEKIDAALASSRGVIVIVSCNAVSSRNVRDEVSFAIDKGKDVIPVLNEACEIPFRWRRTQYVDFTSGFDKGFMNLGQR